tara:strand:+ start:13767 stop:14939 length:1173 start_codon:yes stop_codon:yes gene_type:complete
MPEGLKSGPSKPSSKKHSWGWDYDGSAKPKPTDFEKEQRRANFLNLMMKLKRWDKENRPKQQDPGYVTPDHIPGKIQKGVSAGVSGLASLFKGKEKTDPHAEWMETQMGIWSAKDKGLKKGKLTDLEKALAGMPQISKRPTNWNEMTDEQRAQWGLPNEAKMRRLRKNVDEQNKMRRALGMEEITYPDYQDIPEDPGPGDEEQLADLEKEIRKMQVLHTPPSNWENLSDEEKAQYTLTNEARMRGLRDLVDRSNVIRARLGLSKIEYPEYRDPTHGGIDESRSRADILRDMGLRVPSSVSKPDEQPLNATSEDLYAMYDVPYKSVSKSTPSQQVVPAGQKGLPNVSRIIAALNKMFGSADQILTENELEYLKKYGELPESAKNKIKQAGR